MSTRTKRAKRNAETQTGHLDSMLEIARLQEQVTLLTIENDHLRKHITENRLSKPATPRNSDAPNTPSTRASSQRTTQLKNKAGKNGRVTGRGCNCSKGNCSNRTCGCVKKDMQCGESCRCNNTLCQNQEERGTEGNKENEESNEHVEPEKITNKPLANVAAHKSIFSPDGTLHSTPMLEPSRPSAIYFGSPKKLAFELDEEETEEEKNVKRKGVKNSNADRVNGSERVKRERRPRVRGNRLEVNTEAHTRKLRSSSNEEKGNNTGVEKQTLRRCSSTEISIQSLEKLEEINNRAVNRLRNIADGIAPLRRRQKEKGSVKGRRKNGVDSDSREESRPASVEGNDTEASQDAAVQVSTSLDQEQMGSPLSNDLHGSGCSDDSDFNPMRPQHELTRTPAQNSDSSSGNTSSLLADIRPLTPVFTIKVEELPIPPELSQPEVDWDEHQSQLVACKKCKRKFHSFRIAKHQACCKKL